MFKNLLLKWKYNKLARQLENSYSNYVMYKNLSRMELKRHQEVLEKLKNFKKENK